jgi:uncharacterized membrane protein YfcA
LQATFHLRTDEFHCRIGNFMTEPLSLLIIAAAFIVGGAVKGLAGLGLPVITVAVLTFAFGLPNAMALMLIPGLIANFWQALGPYFWPALKRISIFLVPSLFTIWFGTGLLVTLDSAWLVTLLGLILSIYAITGISGFSLTIPATKEKFIGPVFGLLNGITTGMTGVTSTPSVIYLNGLGMKREMFIQSMGLLFLISYVVLTASMWLRGLINVEIGGLSLFAAIPALIGMWIGRVLRQRTSESGFKRIFYWVLLLIGVYLIVRAVWS